MKLIKNYLGI